MVYVLCRVVLLTLYQATTISTYAHLPAAFGGEAGAGVHLKFTDAQNGYHCILLHTTIRAKSC